MTRIKSSLTILAIIFLCHLPSKSQSWHPFPSQGPWLYHFATGPTFDDGLHGFAIDSMGAMGADSIFYFNRMARWIPIGTYELDCDGNLINPWSDSTWISGTDNILGHAVIVKTNGDVRFCIDYTDTLELKMNAAQGTTWMWGSDTVSYDSAGLWTVLGQIDSLKYFSLSGGREMVVSKSFGLVRAFSLRPVKYYDPPLTQDIFSYEIWGIESMGLGDSLPRFKDYFAWQPGEYRQRKVFDYYVNNSGPQANSVTYYDETIQSWTYSPQTNSYSFQISYDKLVQENIWSWSSSYQTGMSTNGTVNASSYEPEINALPGSYAHVLPASNENYFCTWIGISAVHNDRIYAKYLPSSGFLGCKSPMYPLPLAWADLVETYTLMEGLGETYYFMDYVDTNFNDDVYETDEREILCYQKLNDTVGNCENLALLAPLEDELATSSLKVFPNPASDHFVVELDGVEGELVITDLFGKELAMRRLSFGGKSLLAIKSWVPGIYLVKLDTEKHGTLSQKLLVR